MEISNADSGSLDMASELARFEARLRQVGSPAVDRMAPGIPAHQVREALRPLGLEAPRELLTWFGWHDGYPPGGPGWSGETALFRFHPLSVAEAVAEYRRQHHFFPEVWGPHPTWLPLGRSGGAPLLVVDCPTPQQRLATVRVADPFSGDFDEEKVRSVTGFATVVSWWSEALEVGAHVYVPGTDASPGGWDDVPDKWLPLMRERPYTMML